MPTTRCITIVSTWCSTSSAARVSAKQAANRSVSRIARSVWPSNKAPASEVIAPPSKEATTSRPSTGGNSSSAGLQSVGIGASCGFEKNRGRNTIFSESAPQCTEFGEKCGLALGSGPAQDGLGFTSGVSRFVDRGISFNSVTRGSDGSTSSTDAQRGGERMPRSAIMGQWMAPSLSAACHRPLPAPWYSESSIRFWAYLKPRSGCVAENGVGNTAA